MKRNACSELWKIYCEYYWSHVLLPKAVFSHSDLCALDYVSKALKTMWQFYMFIKDSWIILIRMRLFPAVRNSTQQCEQIKIC